MEALEVVLVAEVEPEVAVLVTVALPVAKRNT